MGEIMKLMSAPIDTPHTDMQEFSGHAFSNPIRYVLMALPKPYFFCDSVSPS